MTGVKHFIEASARGLQCMPRKCGVDRQWNRKFLDFTINRSEACRIAESSVRHQQMGTTQVTLLSLDTMGTGGL